MHLNGKITDTSCCHQLGEALGELQERDRLVVQLWKLQDIDCCEDWLLQLLPAAEQRVQLAVFANFGVASCFSGVTMPEA